jgi:hypothetical protein
LLASVFLHYLFDLWVQAWRRRAHGDVIIVRYADDIVLGFQIEAEARRFWAETLFPLGSGIDSRAVDGPSIVPAQVRLFPGVPDNLPT